MATLPTTDNHIKWGETESQSLWSADVRLDANYYNIDGLLAKKLIDSVPFKKIPLTGAHGLASAYHRPRFKRIFVRSSAYPIFQPGQINESYPEPAAYISARTTTDLEALRVYRGTILLTCSGTVGNSSLVSKLLDGQLFSHDLIRIKPKNDNHLGYIYAYLNSTIGKTILLTNNYGAVVRHIEPHHLDDVMIPLLGDLDIQKIDNDVLRAFTLRDQANDLIQKSEELFYELLRLPRINEDEVAFYGGSGKKAWETGPWSNKFRLDASYYHPIGMLVTGKYKEAKLKSERLGAQNKVFELPTYKRIYLEEGFGVPFLSGRNLTEYQFSDLKYLSKTPIKNLDQYLVDEGMLLITMRGTCGNVRLVDRSIANYGASHNIMRLQPGKAYNGGFLYTFLRSDYGSKQMKTKILGSVVDVLTPEDCADIIVPVCDTTIQEMIGSKVEKALALRARANELEAGAIEYLEEKLVPSTLVI